MRLFVAAITFREVARVTHTNFANAGIKERFYFRADIVECEREAGDVVCGGCHCGNRRIFPRTAGLWKPPSDRPAVVAAQMV